SPATRAWSSARSTAGPRRGAPSSSPSANHSRQSSNFAKGAHFCVVARAIHGFWRGFNSNFRKSCIEGGATAQGFFHKPARRVIPLFGPELAELGGLFDVCCCETAAIAA